MVIFWGKFGKCRVCAVNIEAKQKIYVKASVHGRYKEQKKFQHVFFCQDFFFFLFLRWVFLKSISYLVPKSRCKEPPANVWNWQTSDRQLAWKPIKVVSLALAKYIIWSPRSIHNVAFFFSFFFYVCIWSSPGWWIVLASIFQEPVWNSAFPSLSQSVCSQEPQLTTWVQ